MITKRYILLVAVSFFMMMATMSVVCTACPPDATLSTDTGLDYSTMAVSTTGFSCDITGSPKWELGINTVNCTNCTFTVTVTDNEFPSISCPSPISQHLSTTSGFIVSWATPVATDNVDVVENTCNPASGSSFQNSVGTDRTVTCTAKDNANNIDTCLFTVTLTDDVPPTTSCPAARTEGTDSGASTGVVTWNKDDFFTDTVGVASSSCTPMSGSPFSLGTTDVTCSADDAAGNAAMCSFMVTIVDQDPPVFDSCPSGTLNKNIDGADIDWSLSELSVKATWDKPIAVDNDGNAPTLTSSHRPGDLLPAGVTEVTYNATDQAGNVASCSFMIVVGFQPQPKVSVLGLEPPGDNDKCFDVAWTRSQDVTVKEYIISAWRASQDEADVLQKVVKSDGSAVTTYIRHDFCMKFFPGVLYNVKVEAVGGESSQLELIETTQQWTRPDAPGSVTEVPGTKSPASVEVKWSPVDLQNVEQYLISGLEYHTGYVTKTTDQILVDLFSVTYNVTVQAVVGSGDERIFTGAPGQLISTFDDLEESKLLALSTESTIHVYWKSTLPSDNDPFMLYIEPEEAEESYLTFSGQNGPVVFRGLKPNTEYQIRLIHNLGLSLSTSVTTKPGPPSRIRFTEVQEDSLTLEWNPPIEGSVDSYEVYISPGESIEPLEVSGTSYTFSSLSAKTEYFVKVVSIYDGVKSLPKTLSGTTGVTKAALSTPLNILAIVLGGVLGVVALLLIVGIVVTCRKFQKLKAKMNTHAGYDTAITGPDRPAQPAPPVKVDVGEPPQYQNSDLADRLANRIISGPPKTKKTDDEGEYVYANPE